MAGAAASQQAGRAYSTCSRAQPALGMPLVFGTPVLTGKRLPLLIVCLMCSVSVNLLLLAGLFLRQPNPGITSRDEAHQFVPEPPHDALKHGHLLHPHHKMCTTEQLVILLLLVGNAVQWYSARW
jgi:hypothetical protein